MKLEHIFNRRSCAVYQAPAESSKRSLLPIVDLLNNMMFNHNYCSMVSRDFGPFFIYFYLYIPYNAKLCIHGHEYFKFQLDPLDLRRLTTAS